MLQAKQELWGRCHRALDRGDTPAAIKQVRAIRAIEAKERTMVGRNHPTRLRRWGRR